MTNLFRWIPSIETLLNRPEATAITEVDRKEKTEIARKEVNLWREKIKKQPQEITDRYETAEAFHKAVLSGFLRKLNAAAYCGFNMRRVINGTGIVLHTNLGRTPLAEQAVEAVNQVMTGYCNLELDLETGERSENRFSNVHDLICQITGAQDCLVVNNNAAAILLALNTFGYGKEGIISRGQLVEIGGSFRVPEIMEKSGVKLYEIGTTNKTRISDYQTAINETTGVLLVIHPSNFHMTGFVETPELGEIAALGKKHDITTIYDWGCGALYPLAGLGIGRESTVKKLTDAGLDIITFSGDKLLGGPQCGIIIGSKEKISAMYQNPLTRALRPDKMILAALEGTLRCYKNLENVRQAIPVLRSLTKEPLELEKTARTLADKLAAVQDHWEISIDYTKSLVGGGSLPDVKLPTCVVKVEGPKNLNHLAKELRSAKIPIIGYIHGNAFHIDVRTLLDGDVDFIAEAFANLPNIDQP